MTNSSREINVYVEDLSGLEFGVVEELTLQKELIDVVSLIKAIGWATNCMWDLSQDSTSRGSMQIRVSFNNVTYCTENKSAWCICGGVYYGSNRNQLRFIRKHAKLCVK